MITFKQYLAEARMAPLYHGTTMKFFDGIIDNGFEPRTLHAPERLLKTTGNYRPEHDDDTPSWGTKVTLDYVKGISTTRNFKFAAAWGKSGNKNGWVVFEFDQQKLTHRYQIKPIQYFAKDFRRARFQGDNDKNEFEEFIITTKNVPLSFVKAIHFFVKEDAHIESLRRARKKHPHITFKKLEGSEALD